MIPSSNHHAFVIESQFRSQLATKDALKIIEAGIKFFLFQRGQIPIPYEKLHKAATQDGSTTKVQPHCESCVEYSSTPGLKRHVTSPKENESLPEVNENFEGWSRLRLIKSQLRAKRQEIRMTAKLNRLLHKEMLAREIWDDLFEKLGSIFLSPTNINVSAIIVMFGPSIYNPKETITFKIDPALILGNSKDRTERGQDIHDIGGFPTVLREFHKKIIMSSGFLDFTTKPLRSTGSHVCIVTEHSICDEKLRENFILLENFPKGLLQSGTIETSSNEVFGVKNRNKSLEVSLQLSEHGKNFPLREPVSATNVFVEHVKPELQNSEFYNVLRVGSECSPKPFCYQIPMRYRGFSVGNK